MKHSINKNLKSNTMKNLSFKLFTALFAVTLLAGVTIFYACQKEDKLNIPESRAKAEITADISNVDFSKIDYKGGMLIFKSVEDYAQTIDALLAVCDKYAADYVAALEKKLGVPIDKADEEVIADYVIKDDFFPFNPLMNFIEQFGFKESAYPVLREQEKEWLAKHFDSAENPFDILGAGYVQSALHNSKGNVMIEGQLLDWDLALNADAKGCATTKEKYADSPYFYYNGKTRHYKGMVKTTSINVHAKTGAYYTNNAGNSTLWLTSVEVGFFGKKWPTCYYEGPVDNVPNCKNDSKAGLTEKYFTFNLSPTYLNPSGGLSITSGHSCTNGNPFSILIGI